MTPIHRPIFCPDVLQFTVAVVRRNVRPPLELGWKMERGRLARKPRTMRHSLAGIFSSYSTDMVARSPSDCIQTGAQSNGGGVITVVCRVRRDGDYAAPFLGCVEAVVAYGV